MNQKTKKYVWCYSTCYVCDKAITMADLWGLRLPAAGAGCASATGLFAMRMRPVCAGFGRSAIRRHREFVRFAGIRFMTQICRMAGHRQIRRACRRQPDEGARVKQRAAL